MRHQVRRQTLEVAVPSRRAGMRIHDRLREVMRGAAADVVDACCSAASAPDRLDRIDTLTVDLGRLDPGDLEHDVVARLAERLPGALAAALRERAALSPPSPAPGRDSAARADSVSAAAELVIQFARTGALPWWADVVRPRVVAEAVGLLAARAPAVLAAAVAELASERAAVLRLVRHLDDGVLAGAVRALLGPGRRPAGAPELARLLSESPALRKLEARQRRAAIWAGIVLGSVAAPSVEAASAGWEAALVRIAQEAGVRRSELTSGSHGRRIAALLDPAPAGTSETGGLPAALADLVAAVPEAERSAWAELAAAASAGAPRAGEHRAELRRRLTAGASRLPPDIVARALAELGAPFGSEPPDGRSPGRDDEPAAAATIREPPAKGAGDGEPTGSAAREDGGRVDEAGARAGRARGAADGLDGGAEGPPVDRPAAHDDGGEEARAPGGRRREVAAAPEVEAADVPHGAPEVRGGAGDRARWPDGSGEDGRLAGAPERPVEEAAAGDGAAEVGRATGEVAGPGSDDWGGAERGAGVGAPGAAAGAVEAAPAAGEVARAEGEEAVPGSGGEGHAPPHPATAPAGIVADVAFGDADEAYVGNAGLAVLTPFLTSFFTRLGLVEEGAFVAAAAAHRATGLLQHAVTGDREPPEYQLVLAKVLCGVHPGELLDFGKPVTDAEAAECELLLEAALAQAPVLGELSVAGLRSTFLARRGMLRAVPGTWQLIVERETYDVLLDRLPWQFGWVKLPWMELPLEVDW